MCDEESGYFFQLIAYLDIVPLVANYAILTA